MRFSRWLPFAVGSLMVAQIGAVAVEGAGRPPAGPLVTIHAPQPRQYEVALDEVGLDWSGVPGAKTRRPALTAFPVAGTSVAEFEAIHALISTHPVPAPRDLLPIAKALQAANPGAEAYLVLYEPGLPKSKATRQLLTREVGLLMEQGRDPRDVLTGRSESSIRPVPGVPNGYVIETADPLAGLDLAEALRQQPGVRSAYPLLKRHYVKR